MINSSISHLAPSSISAIVFHHQTACNWMKSKNNQRNSQIKAELLVSVQKLCDFSRHMHGRLYDMKKND